MPKKFFANYTQIKILIVIKIFLRPALNKIFKQASNINLNAK